MRKAFELFLVPAIFIFLYALAFWGVACFVMMDFLPFYTGDSVLSFVCRCIMAFGYIIFVAVAFGDIEGLERLHPPPRK